MSPAWIGTITIGKIAGGGAECRAEWSGWYSGLVSNIEHGDPVLGSCEIALAFRPVILFLCGDIPVPQNVEYFVKRFPGARFTVDGIASLKRAMHDLHTP